MPGAAVRKDQPQATTNGTVPDEERHSTPVEHNAPSRLVAQRVLFSGPSALVPDELYVDTEAGVAITERHRLVMGPHASVTTNTYFGRFPASYWQRWTGLTEVEFESVVSGSGRLSVLASDAHGDSRIVAARSVVNTQRRTIRLTVEIDKFADGGALWFDARAGDGDFVIEDVRWTVRPPKRLRPTAVVICTYNRADDCLSTLAALAGDAEPLGFIDAVHVVDQGTDLVESRPRFAEVKAALGGKLHYLRQDNLGGAGGFTRGLYEVTEVSEADHANVLFMDDDVLCEPDIVIRLTSFANRTTNPVIVGGQMLRLLHPTMLHAAAEYADLEALTPGKLMPGALGGTDLTGRDDEGRRNAQDLRVDAEYNGWWACLIPSEVVAAVGFPLPIFFQWDDIEYGYRARGRGFPTVTLPGAGLWHADFAWKDWDDWHRYFNLRNSLICAALHSEFRPRRVARELLRLFTRYLVGMQYGLAATLLKAIEDFLVGPEMLHDGGVTAAAEIRKLRAEYPETYRHPVADVPSLAGAELPLIPAAPAPSATYLVLVKRVLHQLLGRSVHRAGTVPLDDATWWHVSLFDTAVVTDASQEGVRVRRRDRELMIRLAKRGAALLRRFIKEAPALQRRYRAALPELTSRDNWKRLYEL